MATASPRRAAKTSREEFVERYFALDMDIEAVAAELGLTAGTAKQYVYKYKARDDPRYEDVKARLRAARSAAKAGGGEGEVRKKKKKKAAPADPPVEAPAAGATEAVEASVKKTKKKKRRSEVVEAAGSDAKPETAPEAAVEAAVPAGVAAMSDDAILDAYKTVKGNVVKAAGRLGLSVSDLAARLKALRAAGNAQLLEMERRVRAEAAAHAQEAAAEKSAAADAKALEDPAPAAEAKGGAENGTAEAKTPSKKRKVAEAQRAELTTFLQASTDTLDDASEDAPQAKAASQGGKRKRTAAPGPPTSKDSGAGMSRVVGPAPFKEMSKAEAAAVWADARLEETVAHVPEMLSEACRLLPPLGSEALVAEVHGAGGGRGMHAVLAHLMATQFVAPKARCLALDATQLALSEKRNHKFGVDGIVVDAAKLDGRQRAKILGRSSMELCLLTFAMENVASGDVKGFLGKMGAMLADDGVMLVMDRDNVSAAYVEDGSRAGMIGVAVAMSRAGLKHVCCSWKRGELYVLRGVKGA